MFSSLLFHKWLIDIVSIAHLPKKSDIFCESFPRNPQFRSRHPLLGRLRAHHAVYGTVCTNAAFLGNAITEGIFGAEGLMLTSIFLIPQRMAMWSVGVSYFMHDAGAPPLRKKSVLTGKPLSSRPSGIPASWPFPRCSPSSPPRCGAWWHKTIF